MPEMKTWFFEFIQPDDVDKNEIAEFTSIAELDQEGDYESLTARCKYRGEFRKVNINKGNGKRLSEAFGTNTDNWRGKKFRIRLPETNEEKKSRMKLIIEPVQSA